MRGLSNGQANGGHPPIVSGPKHALPWMETVCWLIFCLVSLHLAFVRPYVVLLPGERTNVFSGILCIFALLTALLLAFRRPVRGTAGELLVTLGLIFLAVTSGLLSLTPFSSSLRVLVLIGSGVGGFWCARILLNSPSRQKAFAWLCAGCLAGIIVASLRLYPETGKVNYLLYSRSHPLIQMLLLFAAGPLALMSWRKPYLAVVGIMLLIGTYVTLYLTGIDDTRSAVLIPMAVLAVPALFGSYRSGAVPVGLVLLFVLSAAAAYYASHLSHRGLLQYQEYRLESYPFSWHIAKQHPVLGIGLRSPRDEFLEGYRVKLPAYGRDTFEREVKYLVTSENVFLTFMSGLGLPFLILYALALVVLLARLFRLLAKPPPYMVFHPLVLLVPLTGSILHLFTTDALLYPQVNWFFHVLLGLIPSPPVPAGERQFSATTVCMRLAAATAAVALGIVAGTHQAFAPANIPGISFVAGKRAAATPSAESGDRAATSTEPGHGKSTEAAPLGSLVVNLEGYRGAPEKWAVMLLVDNSPTMAAQDNQGAPSRLRVACDFVSGFAAIVPHTSKMAIRAFSAEVSGRKDGKEVPLRVSRLLRSWTDGPVNGLQDLFDTTEGMQGRNHLIAAALHSLRRDFATAPDYSPRIVLLTDGSGTASANPLLEANGKLRKESRVKIDVVALAMSDSARRAEFRKLVGGTGGMYLAIERSQDIDAALATYKRLFQEVRPAHIEVQGAGTRYKTLPGKELKLTSGEYRIVLPHMEGLSHDKAAVLPPVPIRAGETRTVTIRVNRDGVTQD
ncbi:MAG: hypothetical protein HY914_21350 [Desulfomonile tiedjei]|nr:hypothetical protein [Desulfomonile tiedjei]